MAFEILLDTSVLPFESTPGDWFNCFHQVSGEMIYIDHRVIIALMNHRGEKVLENPEPLPGTESTDGVRWLSNFSETYSEYGNGIGTSIVRYLQKANPPREHNTVLEFYLPNFNLPMLLGWFGGKTFVFFDRR